MAIRVTVMMLVVVLRGGIGSETIRVEDIGERLNRDGERRAALVAGRGRRPRHDSAVLHALTFSAIIEGRC